MIGGLLQAFLSLKLVSLSVSFDPGWLLLVSSGPVTVEFFGAPASPLVLGRLLHLRRLRGFSSRGCPGSSAAGDAVCDQWVWFLGTGRPCKGPCGWFSLFARKFH